MKTDKNRIDDRKLHILSIRDNAHDLVGPCSDYQIMFCAQHAGKIASIPSYLEQLDDIDLRRLANWLLKEKMGAIRGSDGKRPSRFYRTPDT